MDTAITKAAYELILRFQDESDIPKRLKKDKSQVSSKQNIDSLVEQRFKMHVKAWTETINSIFKYVNDNNQGWRFIRCNPEVIDTSIKSVTLCKDFLDFTDLLALRRDIDMCDADELGKLCMLHTAFQREIEKRINQ
jgi:hypothetical protein